MKTVKYEFELHEIFRATLMKVSLQPVNCQLAPIH